MPGHRKGYNDAMAGRAFDDTLSDMVRAFTTEQEYRDTYRKGYEDGEKEREK